MQDETIDTGIDETDSTPAGAESGTEGVDAESPPASGEEPQQRQSRHVPYDRFKEVNDAKKQAEAELNRLREQQIRAAQASRRTDDDEPIFGESEDKLLKKFMDRELSKARQKDQQELAALKMELTRQKIAAKRPEWAEHEEEVGKLYGELMREGFSGEKAAEVLLDAYLARTGQIASKAKADSEQRNASKNRQAVPRGAAPETKPKGNEPDYEAMRADGSFRALVDRVTRQAPLADK